LFDLAPIIHPISFLEYGTPVTEARGVVVIRHGHAEDETMARENARRRDSRGNAGLGSARHLSLSQGPHEGDVVRRHAVPEPRTVNSGGHEVPPDVLTRMKAWPEAIFSNPRAK
jgi:hypothetical protein